MSKINHPFKSLVQGYFDFENGKVRAGLELDKMLSSWNITRDELKSIIEVAKSDNKKRPYMVDDVMTYAISKNIEMLDKSEIVKFSILGLVILLMESIDNIQFTNNWSESVEFEL